MTHRTKPVSGRLRMRPGRRRMALMSLRLIPGRLGIDLTRVGRKYGWLTYLLVRERDRFTFGNDITRV